MRRTVNLSFSDILKKKTLNFLKMGYFYFLTFFFSSQLIRTLGFWHRGYCTEYVYNRGHLSCIRVRQAEAMGTQRRTSFGPRTRTGTNNRCWLTSVLRTERSGGNFQEDSGIFTVTIRFRVAIVVRSLEQYVKNQKAAQSRFWPVPGPFGARVGVRVRVNVRVKSQG